MAGRVRITPGALVCNEAEILGDVTIGAKTIIHPKARIVAEQGPIVIGEGNLFEEQTLIINRTPGHTLHIGNQNVFEIGATVEAVKIGDNNIFEAKSTVTGPNIEVTNGCVVSAMCHVGGDEVLPENIVVYGENCARRRASERPPPQTLQLEFLMKILPNYHHLKRPQKT